jgi:hypothetical protein
MPKFLVTLTETINKEWQIEVEAPTAKEAKFLVSSGKVDYLDGEEQDEESEIEIQYVDELEEA